MEAAVIALGVVAEGAAWWLVGRERLDVWRVLPVVLGALGLGVVVFDPPSLARGWSLLAAAGVGVGVGVALYLATRLFVVVAERMSRAFGRHAAGIYAHRGPETALAPVLLAALATVVGEELFWRGYVQRKVGDVVKPPLGRAIAWGLYVVANVPSANLAILAGAAVGGAVWVGLAVWSHGVLASLLCHATWTGLMLAAPAIGGGSHRE